MNRPIARLFVVILALFALLVGFTSRWTVFEASALRHNPLNSRALLEQEHIARGEIVASDGAVLARSTRSSEGAYERHYPYGELFADPIGYYFPQGEGIAGLEEYRDTVLSGQNETGFQTILNQLQGKQPEGEKVVTTLNVRAQRVAAEALAGHRGAVVALEPATGAVRVMTSSPSYDPQDLGSHSAYERLLSGGEASLFNRATQEGYAPGSTFKIVTATAAIDTGAFSQSSLISGANGIVVSGKTLDNDNRENFGLITLKEAMTKSVDTAFAQVAERVGKQTLARYMDRFGFDHEPQLDYPTRQMTPSGEYYQGHVLAPTDPRVDVGRLGIGQDKLRVTPLQMAEVAAAVANRGKLMVPHLTERIVDPEGGTVQRIKPRVQATVMKPSTAEAVREMMEAVVNEGTGTPAQIPGVQVAGKTGTAETQFGSSLNDAWFVAFAPARSPRVAIAVTLEKVPGYGATYAAPVAKRVMEALLG
jgi:peptidoglycan glycosyltransferase